MKKLKEKLNAKLNKNGGFTLVEMLIVVAIIAILIAIAIPMINDTLEKAREAVDDANERSAVSLGYAYYLTASKPEDIAAFKTGKKMYFSTTAVGDTNTLNKGLEGGLVEEDDKPTTGYGKGTALGQVDTPRKGQIIEVTIKDPATATDQAVTVKWVDVGTGG